MEDHIMGQESLQRRRKNLSREEGAIYLGISPRLFDKLAKAGQIRTYRIGRRVLVDIADLDAFAESQKQSAAV
jgi:excisionase family DNA binding protein